MHDRRCWQIHKVLRSDHFSSVDGRVFSGVWLITNMNTWLRMSASWYSDLLIVLGLSNIFPYPRNCLTLKGR